MFLSPMKSKQKQSRAKMAAVLHSVKVTISSFVPAVFSSIHGFILSSKMHALVPMSILHPVKGGVEEVEGQLLCFKG